MADRSNNPVARQTAHDALVERGKALVESGKHAPPAQQWTADELRYWFGPAQLGDVVSLDDYRLRRAGWAE